MTQLLRATEVIGLPVVGVGDGEALAEVRDVVYLTGEARLLGFTLNGRGFLAGPRRRPLPWARVVGLGRDAVMVAGADVLDERDERLERRVRRAAHRDVLGAEVLSEAGQGLGHVTDVVLLAPATEGAEAEVVGYEVAASQALGTREGRRVFLPLPETLSVSGEALMVPATVREFVTDDLAGLGSAVERFRDHLRGAP